MAKIKEIFASIQGEGPFVGYKQLFIRFCGCNLNCKYCDTDFFATDAKEYSPQKISEIIKEMGEKCHSVSLTGGEPLLYKDFIKEFAPESPLPIYLETNGTLYCELEEVIDYITFVSADIKLPSATGMKPLWTEHDRFFEIAAKKDLFAKAVFDSHITPKEIESICNLCSKYNIELILQPMMNGVTPVIESDFMEKVLDSCLEIYPKVRLIPQVHKFINVI